MHWTIVVTSRFVSVHRFLVIVNIFSSNSEIIHHILGVSSTLIIWLSSNQLGRIYRPLQRHLFEIWKGRQGELHIFLHLVDVPYHVTSSPCMSFEMNLW